MRALQLVLLMTTMAIGTYQKACDGQTAEMFQYNFKKPAEFVGGGVGVVDVKTYEECGHICAQNKECAFAWFAWQTCYQAGYATVSLKPSEGIAMLKHFPNATTCGVWFPKILSNNQATYKLPWKAGASFSWSMSGSNIDFKYKAN